MMANVSSAALVSIAFEALSIGMASYIYIVAGMNVAVAVVVLFEAVRMKGWNYMSVMSTAVSSSMEEREIGSKAELIHRAREKNLTGDASDRINRGIAMRLRRRHRLTLTLEGDGQWYRDGVKGRDIGLPEWRQQPHVTG